MRMQFGVLQTETMDRLGYERVRQRTTIGEIARLTGRGRDWVSERLLNKTGVRLDDLELLCAALGLTLTLTLEPKTPETGDTLTVKTLGEVKIRAG